MWDFEDYLAKARLYFGRGAAHPRNDDDDAAAIWLIQGLEFLLRAVLAEANPVLLVEAKNEAALMHAAGYPMASDSLPSSVPITTVIKRVAVVVPEFSPHQQDARDLFVMRNGEAHSSLRPLDVDAAAWLPRFTRVVEVLCAHLGLDAAELAGEEMIGHGRLLVDAEDQKLRAEVQRRIRDAHSFITGLTPAELEARCSQELPAWLPDELWMPPADLPYRRLGGIVDLEWVATHAPASDDVDPYDLTPAGSSRQSAAEQVLASMLAQPPSLAHTCAALSGL